MLEMFALVIQLKLETVRQAAYIAELESRPPAVEYIDRVEYRDRVEYIDRVVTETVTERVEVPRVETVEVLPEGYVQCAMCGDVTDWREYVTGDDGTQAPVCYACWEYGGCKETHRTQYADCHVCGAHVDGVWVTLDGNVCEECFSHTVGNA